MGNSLAICLAHSRCWLPQLSFYWDNQAEPFTRSYSSMVNRHLSPGPCSPHPTAPFPDVLTLDWENSVLNGRSLRYRCLLVVLGVQTLLTSFSHPGPRCLQNTRSLIPARTLLSLLWHRLLPILVLSLKWHQTYMKFATQLSGGSRAYSSEFPGNNFNMNAVIRAVI